MQIHILFFAAVAMCIPVPQLDMPRAIVLSTTAASAFAFLGYLMYQDSVGEQERVRKLKAV